MGRWATRRVRGGGPPPVVALIYMLEAQRVANDELQILYNRDITFVPFQPNDFTTSPDARVGMTIVDQLADTLTIQFSNEILTQNLLTFVSMTTNVYSPQTIVIT